jgi:hypothetical protein
LLCASFILIYPVARRISVTVEAASIVAEQSGKRDFSKRGHYGHRRIHFNSDFRSLTAINSASSAPQ